MNEGTLMETVEPMLADQETQVGAPKKAIGKPLNPQQRSEQANIAVKEAVKKGKKDGSLQRKADIENHNKMQTRWALTSHPATKAALAERLRLSWIKLEGPMPEAELE